MKFSVIIPAYNREKELPKCIESVLEQTYKNFEIIIVDNGSTDSTKEIVQNYINQDSRIKYFWQENSGSPAGSRNTGIQKALGEWIAFLDSDDYWYPNKLEMVAKALDENNDTIAVSHYEDKIIDTKHVGILKHGSRLIENNTYLDLLFNGNNLSTSAMTVKKEKLIEVGLFDIRKDYFAIEDYDMWMKLSKIGKFSYIKIVLGAFIIAGSNMSGNTELINNNLKTLVLNHIESLDTSEKEKLKIIHGSRIDYYKGRTYQLNGEMKKAIPILIKSIIEYPFVVKKYISLFFAILGIKK